MRSCLPRHMLLNLLKHVTVTSRIQKRTCPLALDKRASRILTLIVLYPLGSLILCDSCHFVPQQIIASWLFASRNKKFCKQNARHSQHHHEKLAFFLLSPRRETVSLNFEHSELGNNPESRHYRFQAILSDTALQLMNGIR